MTNKNQLTPRLKCDRCQYSDNPTDASCCEACGGEFLDRTTIVYPEAKSSRKPGRKLLLSSLGLAAIVGACWWNPLKLPQISSNVIAAGSAKPKVHRHQSISEVPAPHGNFTFAGSMVFAPLRKPIGQAVEQSNPDFKVTYFDSAIKAPGSGTAIEQLQDKEISFAQTVRPMDEAELSRARQRTIKIESIPVGIDGVIFYTHPDLLVPGLSVAQLQGIFRGKITNWKQVGGVDLPIVAVGFDPTASGTLNNILGIQNQEIGPNVIIARDYTSALRQVASIPGAISYGSAASVARQKTVSPLCVAKENKGQLTSPLTDDGKINTAAFRDGSYPFTRRLFVLLRKDGTLDEQAAIAYANMLLSREGQKILGEAGFVPLQPPN